MGRLGLLAAFLCLAGSSAFAQGTRADDAERTPKPRKTIRVLQHPYDIASFYRGGSGFYAPFWTNEASPYRRGGAHARRPRGEVFGFFPTVFAPAMPLAEAYRER
jgi:hypothetical protein